MRCSRNIQWLFSALSRSMARSHRTERCGSRCRLRISISSMLLYAWQQCLKTHTVGMASADERPQHTQTTIKANHNLTFPWTEKNKLINDKQRVADIDTFAVVTKQQKSWIYFKPKYNRNRAMQYHVICIWGSITDLVFFINNLLFQH